MIQKLSIWMTTALLIGLFVLTAHSQEDVCPVSVQTAFITAAETCESLGRNQACYGHTNLIASPQPDAVEFVFNQSGDVADVAAIRSLQLEPLQPDMGIWGIALMRIQANIPETLPGQAVTFVMFGDTAITNAAESVDEQQLTEVTLRPDAQANLNIRHLPTLNARVVGTIAADQDFIADGRTDDNQWLRVKLPDDPGSRGWVSTELVSDSVDMAALDTINPSEPNFGPMQSFYFTSGIGDAACAGMPGSGLLIQTPEGIGEVTLNINSVDISIGSTILIQSEPSNEMDIAVLEGKARIRAEGQTRTIVAGTEVTVPMSADSRPAGPPSPPHNIETGSVQNIEVANLERDIPPPAPLTEPELEQLTEYNDLLSAIDLDDVPTAYSYLIEQGEVDLYQLITEELDYTTFDGNLTSYLAQNVDFLPSDGLTPGLIREELPPGLDRDVLPPGLRNEALDDAAGIDTSLAPGNSGNAPGQSDIPPGNSGDAPGQSDTPPGQSDNPPGNSGNAPGQNKNPPGQSDSSPGNSDSAPGQSDSSPGQGNKPPGQSNNAPGRSGEAPGRGNSTPDNSSDD